MQEEVSYFFLNVPGSACCRPAASSRYEEGGARALRPRSRTLPGSTWSAPPTAAAG